MDICLVGFGAIGALYGFALERNSDVRLTVVCRSNYETVHNSGLEIESDRVGTHPAWHPYRVVRSVEEAADQSYAFIVCATKSLPDVIPTSAILEPLLKALPASPNTAVVLLQNGVGIEEDVQKALAGYGVQNPVLSGCAWTDSTLVDGGRRIVQHGNERLVLGFHRSPQLDASADERGRQALKTFYELLKSGGVNVEIAPDADAARWRKVLWNASFSTVCTLTRATVGDVLAIPEAREELRQIMLEVLKVARQVVSEDGAAMLPDSVASAVIENENPQSVFKPSMLVDLEAGRPMEIEPIIGGIIRKSQTFSTSVPRLEMIYAALKVLQAGLIKASG